MDPLPFTGTARFSDESASVVDEARKRFDAHLKDPKDGTALPSEYAVPVYMIVLKNGGEEEFEQVGISYVALVSYALPLSPALS